MNEAERAERWRKREEEEELQRMALSHCCAECGGVLVTPWDPERKAVVLRCGINRNHKGFVRPKDWELQRLQGLKDTALRSAKTPEERSRIEEDVAKQEADIQDRKDHRTERRTMEEFTQQQQAALAPLQGVRTLTPAQYRFILETIWPTAPAVEVVKAAMICNQYGLNPLMKHVFLIPFEEHGSGRYTWSVVLGIKAKRLLASQHGPYGYIDGPRMMTASEQEEIRGKVDEAHHWAITVLGDAYGNKFPGYGSWPKGQKAYGDTKGNSEENMAFIRSESQALEKLSPGAMPSGVEVIDAQFLPLEPGSPIELPQEPAEWIAPKAAQQGPDPQARKMPPNPREYAPQSLVDMLGAATHYFNLGDKQLLSLLGIESAAEIADCRLAWEVVLKSQGINAP